MKPRPLSLAEALASGQLGQFISQEEARGIGPADERELLGAIRDVVRPPQSEGQTSRSPSGDGSTET